MPGMAASPAIFDGLKLDGFLFELHRLDWFPPKKGISLSEYAWEMCKKIKHPKPVLLGVSCVKTKHELPKRMLFAKYTKIHKLLPTGLVNNVELLAKYAFGETVTKRLELYEQYLGVRAKDYIDWSIDAIVNWEQTQFPKNLVHIHGEKDAVFPIAHIKNCITVKNGTHTMILHRVKWFNENLPRLILE